MRGVVKVWRKREDIIDVLISKGDRGFKFLKKICLRNILRIPDLNQKEVSKLQPEVLFEKRIYLNEKSEAAKDFVFFFLLL